MITGLIRNWRRKETKTGYVYIGTIYNDITKRYADGDYFKTAQVIKEKRINGSGILIETFNSVYFLAKATPDEPKTKKARRQGL